MKQGDPLLQLRADCRLQEAEAGASQETQGPLGATTVVWTRAATDEKRIQGMCVYMSQVPTALFWCTLVKVVPKAAVAL